MKPLIVLTRIMCVGLFWSVFFIEGVRVIMLENWFFDIFQAAHWRHAWNLWASGWVINTPKEWAFVLIILTFIPVWLCGWAALSMVRWEKIVLKMLRLPWLTFKRGFFRPVKIIAHSAVPNKGIKKRKSYKEVRPRSLRIPLDERAEPANPSKLISAAPQKVKPMAPAIVAAEAPTPSMVKPSIPPAAPAPAAEPSAFTHSLFDMDGSDDDFDFNIDDFDLDKASRPPAAPEKAPQPAKAPKPAGKPAQDNQRQPKKDRRNNSQPPSVPNNNRNNNQPSQQGAKKSGSGNSVMDTIRQHGFETINATTIKNTLVDFIGVAQHKIVLCLIDKEPGDWLADEERFNDEEPLWFSESSHRISPVRKVDLARKFLLEKLEAAGIDMDVQAYVVIAIGNIINAEDMFEIWNDLNVKVTRIDRGTPKDIPLLAKALDDAGASADRNTFENIKKLVRNLA